MSQITVIPGPERRRVWSDEQKRQLVAAIAAPGANVAEIARRADLRPNQIYRWRRQILGLQNGAVPRQSRQSRQQAKDDTQPPPPIEPAILRNRHKPL
jgi:transposase